MPSGLSNLGSAISSGANKAVSAVTNVGSNLAKAVTNVVSPKTSTTPTTTSTKPATSTTTSTKPATSTTTVKAPTAGDILRAAQSGKNVTVTSGGSVLITGGSIKPSSSSSKVSSSTSSKSVTPTITTAPTTNVIQQISTKLLSPIKNIVSPSVTEATARKQYVTTNIIEPLKYQVSDAWKTVSPIEKITTPRLSGLPGVIKPLITLPGDTKSTSTPVPGISSYKNYIDTTTTLSGKLGLTLKPGEVRTTSGKVGTVSDIFVGKGFNIPAAPLKTTVGEQSFSGRINMNKGEEVLKKLEEDITPKINKYNEIVNVKLNPVSTQIVKDANTILQGQTSQLGHTSQYINTEQARLDKWYEQIKNTATQKESDEYNKAVNDLSKVIDKYNTNLQNYKLDSTKYSPIIEEYNKNINEANKLYNDISTDVVMAKDIQSNMILSSVPEKIDVYTGPQKYGPGGQYENKFLSWKGQKERLLNFERTGHITAANLVNPFPENTKWGKIGNVILSPYEPTPEQRVIANPDAIHNPVIRDILEFAANKPALAAGVGAAGVEFAPGFTTLAGIGLGTQTVLGEGYQAVAASGKLPGVSSYKDTVTGPLYSREYTPDMDREARSVLLGSIKQTTPLPTWLGGKAGKEFNPVAWVGEGVNLGFMSVTRPGALQEGVDALFDYYKKQGLSDNEANFRISKAQDSLKITNQREWIELAGAGIFTNLIGSAGVSAAEKTLAPKIVEGTRWVTNTEWAAEKAANLIGKVPFIGKSLAKPIASLTTEEGLRYAAARTAGMFPAGAAEGIYFTGAQKGYRYNQEMTPANYFWGGLAGGASALGAQVFIEQKMPRTPTGGVIRPEPQYTTVFGKELNKPTIFAKPTGREAILSLLDPLEPVSDAITAITGVGSSTGTKVFTSPLTFTNANVNTNANTYATTNVQSKTLSEPFVNTNVQTRVNPIVNTNVATNIRPYINTNALINTNPYVNTNPLTNINENVKVNPEVNPYYDTNPYVDVNPEVNPQVNPEVNPEVNPDVNTYNKLLAAIGWQGNLGSGTGGGSGRRGIKEWIVGNKIATYGEDWFANQQAKAKQVESTFRRGTTTNQFRLAPQGVQVINRVYPQQQFRMPQQQQIIIHEPQVQYNTETKQFRFNQSQETPRQRAQRAVERGFGKIQNLTPKKIHGTHKVAKYKAKKFKGWK